MTVSPWPTRIATLVLAAVLAASVAWWVPRIAAPRPAIAPVPSEDGTATADAAAAARLFGVAPEAVAAAPPSALAGVQVVGLVSGPRGSAVLAIEGEPARSFALGEEVRPGWKVAALDADRVVLAGDGGRLELPAPQRPSLAVLTSGAGQPRDPSGPDAGTPPQPEAAPPSAPGIAPPAEVPGPEPSNGAAASPGLPASAGGSLPPRAGAPR